MRVLIERLPHVVFLFLPWALSVQVFAFLYQQIGIGACPEVGILSFSCLPVRSELSFSTSYLFIAITAFAIICIARLYFHHKSASPFVYFMMSTIFISGIVDYLFDPHIQQINKLFNDSFYIISFIITLSFIIILLVIDEMKNIQIKYIIVCFVSHLSKTITFLVCAIFNIYIDGMIALFMLFFIFSFGTFSLHIMSIVSLFEKNEDTI